ncbi:tripartite tricarboxylate transporter substrate binding protein [Thalassobacillus sp. CUG 92003]|uniref:tripartite tricarboxylate transporter substrate binding protein n=1 Tax=Thalassobacillus sp. CUG 92003 TaxID=2736641 RepID=UPI001C638403|nr:tripartite tricarboxylate transporter substrate-binding protein [Thalassobacillus sp. CUG 92003]
MLRNKFISIIALMMVFLLVGCGNSSEESAGKSDENYPSGNMKFLVAAGAGGGTDNFARQVQPMLEENLGTTISVVNLPSASGAQAHKRTANSEGNGLTLDFASSTYITSLAAGQNPTGLEQLTPVARMQSDVMTLIVNPNKYKNFDEFYEHAKNNPEDVTIGGTHAASPDKMAFLEFKDATGLDLNFIPYDEQGSVSSNVLSGNIDGMFGEISSILGYMESGEMKPILIFAEERLKDFPEIPTTVEKGWDLTNGNERGVFVSADTPDEIVSKIEQELKNIYDSDKYQEYEKKTNLDFREGWLGSEEYREKLEKDLDKYKKLQKENK